MACARIVRTPVYVPTGKLNPVVLMFRFRVSVRVEFRFPVVIA
jgi:hypothetical protein